MPSGWKPFGSWIVVGNNPPPWRAGAAPAGAAVDAARPAVATRTTRSLERRNIAGCLLLRQLRGQSASNRVARTDPITAPPDPPPGAGQPGRVAGTAVACGGGRRGGRDHQRC